MTLGKMSNDRVHFTISEHALRGSDGKAVRTAMRKAFDMYDDKEIGRSDVTILCRPSQFARFLIYRNEGGGRNGFKDLEAKLVPACDPNKVIEVWNRPHQQCYDD